MATDRDWHLVFYDVRDPQRLRRVFKLMKGYGEWIQCSVFRIRGSPVQVESMRWELERILTPEDEILIVRLCAGCARRIRGRNRPDAWPEEDPPFKVIG